MPTRKPRVLLGMAETAGYMAGLQRGFEEIGHSCHFVDLGEHPFGYDRSPALPRLARFRRSTSRRANALPRRSARRGGWRLATGLIDLLITAWAIGHADLFIFTGHHSLLWRNADLPLLRLTGKRVVWVFLGSDHRPPYLNGKWVREALASGDGGYVEMGRRARAYREIVGRIERRAHAVVAMSASAQLHARPFVHLLAVGIPHGGPEDRPTVPAPAPASNGSPVRILHSPSDPAKGSDAIRACVAKLEGRGVAVTYRQISGRPHAEVLDAIAESDLVVDQLYSDSPLAVFATEAGYRHRATVVGGYYADEIAGDVPAELIPPSRYVRPENLCGAIEGLAGDRAARTALGAALATFVRERWSRAAVAGRYLQLAAGGAPSAWGYDPKRLRYVHGWGLSEEALKNYVGELVRRCGASALALDHNPALRKRLVELAAGTVAADATP
jgi:hypothetical protein